MVSAMAATGEVDGGVPVDRGEVVYYYYLATHPSML
jgi:hypothetical protein